MLSLILNKTGFNPRVFYFFGNYLVCRKTRYCWNNFSSPFFDVNIGVGQDSVLSPILSVLYLSPIFHIFKKRVKILNISISVLSFVDNVLPISQSKSLLISNSNLFCSYHIISYLLKQLGLSTEQRKTEIFHFSRSYSFFDPPSLDLSTLGGSVLQSKKNWKYLGFIFNKKLSFY